MMDIKEITFDKIESSFILKYLKKHKVKLPFADLLARLYEKGESHDEYVLEHTILVFDSIKRAFKTKNKIVQSLMKRKFGAFSGYDLLLYAALFHDIGKISTKKIVESKTKFPDHEKISLVIFNKHRNLNLSPSLRDINKNTHEILQNIIRYHGSIHKIVDKKILNPSFESKEFNADVKGLPYIIIFAMLDMGGGKLKIKNPRLYKRRKVIYLRLLKNSTKTEKYI
jgi:hypothetical protein